MFFMLLLLSSVDVVHVVNAVDVLVVVDVFAFGDVLFLDHLCI